MKYKYLKAWQQEIKLKKYKFKKIYRFEDQFIIRFFKIKTKFQINMASEENSIFFTDNKLLPLQEEANWDLVNLNLRNSYLNNIDISENDRILVLHFNKIDMYNQKRELKLILELIPRYQNWILAEDEENDNGQKITKILDCWKKISFAENSERQMLPGSEYKEPPSDYKNVDEKVDYPISFQGRKIVESAEKGFTEMNKAFEHLFYEIILEDRIETIKQQRIKAIKKKIKKKKKKIKILKKEFASAKKEKEWKKKAELLKASFNKIKKGMDSIELIDYYEEPYTEKIKIKLFDDKYPQQNVEYYFKKYKKSKRGKKIIKQQIELAQEEVKDLEDKIFDIQEIDDYFEIKVKKDNKKKKKKEVRKPYKIIPINDEWDILIGKTSRDNDELTLKIANKDDWWFHTRIFKGTHIILRNKKNKNDAPTELKLICAALGAYFSKAQKSSNIPVDCTKKRYVRKPKGSPAGFVIYDHQKTLWVNPLSIRKAKLKLKEMFNIKE